MLHLNWCGTLFQLFVLEMSGDSGILEMGGDHTVIKNGTTSYGQRVRFDMFTPEILTINSVCMGKSFSLTYHVFQKENKNLGAWCSFFERKHIFRLNSLNRHLAHVNTHVSRKQQLDPECAACVHSESSVTWPVTVVMWWCASCLPLQLSLCELRGRRREGLRDSLLETLRWETFVVEVCSYWHSECCSFKGAG